MTRPNVRVKAIFEVKVKLESMSIFLIMFKDTVELVQRVFLAAQTKSEALTDLLFRNSTKRKSKTKCFCSAISHLRVVKYHLHYS